MPLISLRFFIFLSVSLAVYYLAPKRKRYVILAAASLVFYLSAGVVAFIYIFVISLSSYFFAFVVEKGEGKFIGRCYMATAFVLAVWLSARLSAGLGDMLLPLGISFYSLRVISYLCDVGRKSMRAERNFLKYALYVCYFPAVTQGPVAPYSEISGELYCGRGAGLGEFISGGIRIVWGIFKKLVIANALASPLARIYEANEGYSGAYILFLLVFYSAEVYCDFSGGIDIAIGTSRLFGIKLPENFDRPFASRSLREFWNRWHITLGEFFEHYVFYPISLSKPMQRLSRYARGRFGVNIGKRLPLYIAALVTWTCTGLWHGVRVNFIAWGIINGVLVLLSQSFASFRERRKKAWRRGSRLCSAVRASWDRIRVFLIIGAVRLLDLFDSPLVWLKRLCTVFFEPGSYAELFRGGVFSFISPAILTVVLLSLALLFCVSEFGISCERIAERPLLSAVCFFSLLTVILVFGSYGEGFDINDFIYSRY